MELDTTFTYPAQLLLAKDDRICHFLNTSVQRSWNTAVQEWCSQKETLASLRREMNLPTNNTPTLPCKVYAFSDEEFFSLTQQLEDITAVLTGTSASSVARDAPSAEPVSPSKLDLFTLDLSMFSSSFDSEQEQRCHLAREMYNQGNYTAAVQNFSAVIDACLPNIINAPLLGNRAACYLHLENYKFCIRDSIRSYELNDQYVVSMRRAVRAYICSGQCAPAREVIEKYKKSCRYTFEDELAAICLYERYITLLDQGEQKDALVALNELLVQIPCATLETLKVQLTSTEEGNRTALKYVNDCLLRYPQFPELLYWRAQLRFLESSSREELETVLPLFNISVPTEFVAHFRQAGHRVQQCVDFCTELEKNVAKKEWFKLIEACTTALRYPFIGERLRAIVTGKRARGFFEVNRMYECIDGIGAALQNDLDGAKRAQLLLLKSRAEEKLSRWSDALRSAESAMRIDPTAEIVEAWKRLRQRQKDQQRRRQQDVPPREGYQKRVDGSSQNGKNANFGTNKAGHRGNAAAGVSRRSAQLYAHLSLPDGADAEQVKKSYRTLAMRWHPDRWCGASDQEKKKAEETFKLIKTAYDELMSIISP